VEKLARADPRPDVHDKTQWFTLFIRDVTSARIVG
jgi:hypothetical protein